MHQSQRTMSAVVKNFVKITMSIDLIHALIIIIIIIIIIILSPPLE